MGAFLQEGPLRPLNNGCTQSPAPAGLFLCEQKTVDRTRRLCYNKESAVAKGIGTAKERMKSNHDASRTFYADISGKDHP